MKICMPVDQVNGLRSQIALNFRAAPALLVIDDERGECIGIDAGSGACHATPQHIDIIVCAGGIGRGMFNGLRSRGIRVFTTDAMIVEEALAELTAGGLTEISEVECCGGDHPGQGDTPGHQHGCACSSPHGETEKGAGGCSHH